MIPIEELVKHERVWTKFADGEIIQVVPFSIVEGEIKLMVCDWPSADKYGMYPFDAELFSCYTTEEECTKSPEPFYTELQVNMIVPAKMKKEDLEEFLMKHPLARQMTIIIKEEKEIYGTEEN